MSQVDERAEIEQLNSGIKLTEKDLPLISVIVPVYNVKAYLKRCVDSLIHQTYTNIEIILIDDGSTDGSEYLCEECAKKDNRIRVIHQENGGLSAARNTGIDEAKGEWFSFIDSDDYVTKVFLERMLQLARKENAQIVHCKRKTGKKNSIPVPPTGEIFVYSGIECYLNYFTDKKLPALESANNKIFHRDLFRDLRFIPGRIMEDMAIMHQLFERAEKVVYLAEEHYYYFQSGGSIIRGKFTLLKLGALKSYEERLEFFYKVGGKSLWGRALQQYQDTLFRYYYWMRRDCPSYKKEISELKNKLRENDKELRKQPNVSQKVKLLSRIGVHFPYIVGWMSERMISIRFWRR